MGLNRRTIRKGKKKSNNKSKEKEIKQMLDKLDLYDFQRQMLEESIKKVGVGIELSNSEENIEDIIKTLVETSPELNDEVTEASEENVIVEIEIMDTKENINNTVYSEEAIKGIVEEDKSKELEEIRKEEENKSDEDKKVICLDTLDVYENVKDAESKTSAKASAIKRNCNGNSKRAGGLRWMYYKDYLLQENK